MASSPAAIRGSGSPSQTQYNSRSTPTHVKLIRRHHPLVGQVLEVIRGGRVQIVVRLSDGTAMRLPRSWTDLDPVALLPTESIYTVDSLRELLECVAVLRRRA